MRLGAIEDYAAYTLPPILARFISAHPNVSIETETGFSPDLLKRIGESFDLVLAMHPDRSGRGEVVRRERAVWIGSRQHAVDSDLQPDPGSKAPPRRTMSAAAPAQPVAGDPGSKSERVA